MKLILHDYIQILQKLRNWNYLHYCPQGERVKWNNKKLHDLKMAIVLNHFHTLSKVITQWPVLLCKLTCKQGRKYP